MTERRWQGKRMSAAGVEAFLDVLEANAPLKAQAPMVTIRAALGDGRVEAGGGALAGAWMDLAYALERNGFEGQAVQAAWQGALADPDDPLRWREGLWVWLRRRRDGDVRAVLDSAREEAAGGALGAPLDARDVGEAEVVLALRDASGGRAAAEGCDALVALAREADAEGDARSWSARGALLREASGGDVEGAAVAMMETMDGATPLDAMLLGWLGERALEQEAHAVAAAVLDDALGGWADRHLERCLERALEAAGLELGGVQRAYAARALEVFEERAPSARVMRARAGLAMELRDWVGALEAAREGLRRAPGDGALCGLVLGACGELGDVDGALEALEQATSRSVTLCVEGARLLAAHTDRDGARAQALDLIAEARALAPHDTWVMEQAYGLCRDLGAHREAAGALEAWAEVEEDDWALASVYEALAECRAALGDADGARKAREASRACVPDDPAAVLDRAGYVDAWDERQGDTPPPSVGAVVGWLVGLVALVVAVALLIKAWGG